MNANEMVPKADPRLQRIKTVSRIFRYCVLANLVFNIGFWAFSFLSSSSDGIRITVRGLLFSASMLLMFFWFWKLAQLFRLYEHGLISLPKHPLRQNAGNDLRHRLDDVGCGSVHAPPRTGSLHPATDVHLVKAMPVEKHYFRMGFFSFDFGTGIDFGTFFVGASVILAAWIMDEGRKMQEEQELTV